MSFAASGSPEGGQMKMTSSGGRMPWQKAFFTTALFQAMTMLNCQTDEIAQAVKTKNRSKSIAFRPLTTFMIA